MDLTTSRCWVEIDLDTLAANCRALHQLLPPGCRLMNILKANAYGHGAVPTARVLERLFPEDSEPVRQCHSIRLQNGLTQT